MIAEKYKAKLQGGEELGDLEACIGFSFEIATNTADRAAEELAQLREIVLMAAHMSNREEYNTVALMAKEFLKEHGNGE